MGKRGSVNTSNFIIGRSAAERPNGFLMIPCTVDDHISLRTIVPDDAEVVAAVVISNLDRLKPWMPWATDDYSVDTTRWFIERGMETSKSTGEFAAGMMYDGQFSGILGFHHLDTVNRSACLGYWISSEFEGRGIVTKSCQVLLNYLFDTMALHRVQVNCNIENSRSRAVPERLGFAFEGVLREVEYLHGSFRDWAVYSMLSSEWENKRPDIDRTMIIVIIGAQWGDEGKGKVVDLLADRFDIVSRYQGGHNAGHSVYVGDKAFVLRCFRPALFIRTRHAFSETAWSSTRKHFLKRSIRSPNKGISVSARAFESFSSCPPDNAVSSGSRSHFGRTARQREDRNDACAASARHTKTKRADAAFGSPTRCRPNY